jgi:biotin carboxylase
MSLEPVAGARSATSPTVVCLASYFKGGDFLRECRTRGCHVTLVAREKLRDEAWPWDAVDQFVTVPDASASDEFVYAVSAIAAGRRVDRVIALEEYDVLHAAAVREHLCLPGMGVTTARRFRDKLTMRVLTSAAGIAVPPFVHALRRDDVTGFLERVPGPWVLKPRSDVASVGIQKLADAEAVWAALAALEARPHPAERASFHLLEQFIAGEVCHVDALVDGSRVIFAGAHRYRLPPMQVAHQGGVFATTTVARDSEEERQLLDANRAVLAALGLERGAAHAEFIRAGDGRLYFLEAAARVGGAYIAEVLEAASGVNLWRAWARLETRDEGDAPDLGDVRRDYAGIVLALARQEWPDTSAYADPEIVHRVAKRHHAGLIVRSDRVERVLELIDGYATRFGDEFVAVLPPLDKPE